MIDPPDSAQRTGDQLGAAELKEVSLPDYAAADEIAWQGADGAVRSSTKILWADKPQRAFTITLAREISEISGASVVPRNPGLSPRRPSSTDWMSGSRRRWPRMTGIST